VSALSLTQIAFSQTTARIQGVVNDDAGKPVSGVYAVATAQSATDHSTYSAVTNNKGEYSFDNLKPGKYSICVQSPGGPHLGNCQWATTAQATVAAAQTLAGQNITVTQGAVFQLRIDDPKKLIAATDDILAGIYLPSGLFQPMRLAATDPTGRTYDVAVPQKSSFRLAVISSHLLMSDDKGNGLGPKAVTPNSTAPSPATSVTLTLQGPSAVSGPPTTVTVTGRK
jgi:hypothetical protein